jgi:hypothetical protein
MRFEIKKGQNERKWKKMHFAIPENIFLYNSFLASALTLHFKEDL